MTKMTVLNLQLEEDENDQDRHLRRFVNYTKVSQVPRPAVISLISSWPRLSDVRHLRRFVND